MLFSLPRTIVAVIQLSGGSHVILVSFLPDHRTGCRSLRFFESRGDSGRDRKDTARGIPGLVPRFHVFWKTSDLGPDNVRVALVLTGNVLTIKRHSNHINNQTRRDGCIHPRPVIERSAPSET